MKKIIKLGIICLITLFIASNLSYASFTSGAKATSSKTSDLKVNDEITVTVSMTNIGSKIGLLNFYTEIEYDMTRLEYKPDSIKGLNKWGTPGFNERNGRINSIASGLVKDNGAVFEMKFKIKKDDQKNLTIKFKNTMVSDYEEEVSVNIDPINLSLKKDEPIKVTLSEIRVSNEPTKKVYTEGENFDKSGMKVIAKYSNGTEKEVSNYTITDGNNLTKGKANVTISYAEGGITKTAVQAITVNEKKTDNPGENKPGENNPGEDKPGENNPGEDKPGENKPNEDNTDETDKNGNTTDADNTIVDNIIKPTNPDDKDLSENNGDSTIKKDNKLPQTGFNHKVIPGIIIALVVIAWIAYIKIKLIDRKLRKIEK